MHFLAVISFLVFTVAALPKPDTQRGDLDNTTIDLKTEIAKQVKSKDLLGLREGNRLEKRASFSSGLQAVINYNCPISGAQILTIKWRATYDFGPPATLTLTPVSNLNEFTDLEFWHNSFASYMHYKFCFSDYEKHCHYTWLAQTLGTVFPENRSMILSLVTDGTQREDNPKMTEHCQYFARGVYRGNNCSTIPVTAEHAECRITGINVTVA